MTELTAAYGHVSANNAKGILWTCQCVDLSMYGKAADNTYCASQVVDFMTAIHAIGVSSYKRLHKLYSNQPKLG